jgi:hypothetical protein
MLYIYCFITVFHHTERLFAFHHCSSEWFLITDFLLDKGNAKMLD